MGEIFTVNHFLSEEANRSTIFDIIIVWSLERGLNTILEVAVQSNFSTKRPKNNFSDWLDKGDVAQRKLASSFQFKQHFVNTALKNLGLKCYKKLGNVNDFTLITDGENGLRMIRLISQNLIPLSMETTISTQITNSFYSSYC